MLNLRNCSMVTFQSRWVHHLKQGSSVSCLSLNRTKQQTAFESSVFSKTQKKNRVAVDLKACGFFHTVLFCHNMGISQCRPAWMERSLRFSESFYDLQWWYSTSTDSRPDVELQFRPIFSLGLSCVTITLKSQGFESDFPKNKHPTLLRNPGPSPLTTAVRIFPESSSKTPLTMWMKKYLVLLHDKKRF